MGKIDSDQALVERVQAGERSAFDVLVSRYQHKVVKLVMRYVRDQSEALDVTQEAFLKAYRALPRFRGDSAFYTWLYRITINTAKNHLVAARRRPLDYNLERARSHFQQAQAMLSCFEHWFGPYPWYEDGYKLIDVPYPGMEHQSAVTYGNGYANGYGGRDGSRTGLGMEWDFIIIHEGAHEWFANNITARDRADGWVHEAFAK